MRWAIANAFKNAKAKSILNFGETVVPVLKKWAEAAKGVQINKQCNQTCAVDCFGPGSDGPLMFDQGCMDQCGCFFKFSKMDKLSIKDCKQNLEKHVNNLKDFYGERAKEFKEEVTPAF